MAELSSAVLAAERLRGIRAFLLDMDGTFYLGGRILEGALAFLAAVYQTGRAALFVTNNSSRSARAYVDKLAGMGVPEGFRRVYTSGQAAARYCLAAFPGRRVFLLGTPALAEEVAEMGLTLDGDAPEVLLVGYDTTLDYAKLTRACDLARAGLPFIATHPDFNCPTETGFAPDIGAILAFIEASTGRRPDRVIGKPFGDMVAGALERTGTAKAETAMVGDRLYTDIATGTRNGLCSILVLTGEARLADLAASQVQPDLIFERLSDMIPYLL